MMIINVCWNLVSSQKDVWYKNEMRKIKLQLIDDSTKKLKKPKEPPCDIFEELLKQKQKK